MVTHDPMAASCANRVVFLNDGEIVHQLAPDDSHISSDDVIAALA